MARPYAAGVESVDAHIPAARPGQNGIMRLTVEPRFAYQERYELFLPVGVEQLWDVVSRVGGDTGWYSTTPVWAARGWIDGILGGIGFRRGRRDPRRLAVGDAVDFWRVVEVLAPTSDGPGLLRLRAEMRLPGTAWLEMRAVADGASSRYIQKSVFSPSGMAGYLYGIASKPFDVLVFAGLARGIVRRARDG
jgi:hypothetical protein